MPPCLLPPARPRHRRPLLLPAQPSSPQRPHLLGDPQSSLLARRRTGAHPRCQATSPNSRRPRPAILSPAGQTNGVAPRASRCVSPRWRPPQPSDIHGAWAANPGTRAAARATPRPRDPRGRAREQAAPGGKPPLVEAHASLPSPAAPGVVIGHAAGDPWGLVTHASKPEAGRPAVCKHRGVKPAPQPTEGYADVAGESSRGRHCLCIAATSSPAVTLCSTSAEGCEGTKRRDRFVSRPVSRPVAAGLEVPAATTATARPGGVSRGCAPCALASAVLPLTPRPPPPPPPPSRPRPHRLAGGHGNCYGGEESATGQRREWR